MKNRFKPILFSTPMVQAIFKFTKYQTRRTKGLEKINIDPGSWEYKAIALKGDIKKGIDPNIYHVFINRSTEERIDIAEVYSLDDILWVRETFVECIFKSFWYKASDELPGDCWKWKPSIHMPKKACRLFLKVKSVRVERLREIFHSDARAEGIDYIEGINSYFYYNYLTLDYGCNELFSFMTLWQSINGIESWDFNPWVWVIEFERIDKPSDFLA